MIHELGVISNEFADSFYFVMHESAVVFIAF